MICFFWKFSCGTRNASLVHLFHWTHLSMEELFQNGHKSFQWLQSTSSFWIGFFRFGLGFDLKWKFKGKEVYRWSDLKSDRSKGIWNFKSKLEKLFSYWNFLQRAFLVELLPSGYPNQPLVLCLSIPWHHLKFQCRGILWLGVRIISSWSRWLSADRKAGVGDFELKMTPLVRIERCLEDLWNRPRHRMGW